LSSNKTIEPKNSFFIITYFYLYVAYKTLPAAQLEFNIHPHLPEVKSPSARFGVVQACMINWKTWSGDCCIICFHNSMILVVIKAYTS
jgi:hypothetical protein